MNCSGSGFYGRLATRFATWASPPHKASTFLARITPKGYIAPSAQIYHRDLRRGKNVFIGDRVLIFRADKGGHVEIGDRVCILRDSIIETGDKGSLTLGADTYIHPRCQLNAYKASIKIGTGVLIAANCALYPHNHGVMPDRPIREQPFSQRRYR
jgi:acetyltransferase-like isoleucine patch superfamily enzyme